MRRFVFTINSGDPPSSDCKIIKTNLSVKVEGDSVVSIMY